jgi:hypothetical protein
MQLGASLKQRDYLSSCDARQRSALHRPVTGAIEPAFSSAMMTARTSWHGDQHGLGRRVPAETVITLSFRGSLIRH